MLVYFLKIETVDFFIPTYTKAYISIISLSHISEDFITPPFFFILKIHSSKHITNNKNTILHPVSMFNNNIVRRFGTYLAYYNYTYDEK